MSKLPKWVLERLCAYDPRNPDNILDYTDVDWEEYKVEKLACACDNCFYGRTKLAEEIIRLIEGNKPNIQIVKLNEKSKTNL